MLIYSAKSNILNNMSSEIAQILAAIGGLLITLLGVFKLMLNSSAKENMEYRKALKDDYEELQGKFETMQTQHLELQGNFNEMKWENEKLHREVLRLTDEVKSLTTINGDLKIREHSLMEESGRLKAKLDEKDGQITALKEQLLNVK